MVIALSTALAGLLPSTAVQAVQAGQVAAAPTAVHQSQDESVHSTGTHVVASGVPKDRAPAKAQVSPAATVGTAPTESYLHVAGGYSAFHGQSYDITSPTSIQFVKGTNFQKLWADTQISPGHWADLLITTGADTPLRLGTTQVNGYTAGQPLASFGADTYCVGGSGLYGSFTLSEATVDPTTGKLTNLNLSYALSCTASAPKIVGFVRYNASTPTTVQPLPQAALTGSEVDRSVVADATPSSDDYAITDYRFEWGDGSSDHGPDPVVAHPYSVSGPHTVTLTITDATGTADTTQFTVVPDTATLSAVPRGGFSVQSAPLAASSAGIRSYDIDWGDHTAHGTQPGELHIYPRLGSYPITLTVVDNEGQSIATDPVSFTTQGSGFTAVSPVRIMDTRDGTGLNGATPKLTATNPIHLKVAGLNGVPADATAVAVNVTVANNASGDGAVGVTPDNSPLATSNLNYAPGQIVPNMVVVPIANGAVEFQKLGSGQTDVIADLFGYYTAGRGQGYNAPALSPVRVLDTRNGTGWSGGKLAAGKPIRLRVSQGAATDGVTAVTVNLTVTETTGFGAVAAGPAGFTAGKTSWTSNLNYGSGQTTANMAVVPVDADGYVDLVSQGPGSASVIMDLSGSYSATGSSVYVPTSPVRLVDTRQGDNRVQPQTSFIHQTPSIIYDEPPTERVTASVSNTTVVAGTAGGFLTVYLTRQLAPVDPPPTASNLNWVPGQIVPNLTIAPEANDGRGGTVYFNGGPRSLTGTDGVYLIIDLLGYFTAA